MLEVISLGPVNGWRGGKRKGRGSRVGEGRGKREEGRGKREEGRKKGKKY
jgi:hypothetical protein